MQSERILNVEKEYVIDPIWSGFNGVFREMLEGKIKKDLYVLCAVVGWHFQFGRGAV